MLFTYLPGNFIAVIIFYFFILWTILKDYNSIFKYLIVNF